MHPVRGLEDGTQHGTLPGKRLNPLVVVVVAREMNEQRRKQQKMAPVERSKRQNPSRAFTAASRGGRYTDANREA